MDDLARLDAPSFHTAAVVASVLTEEGRAEVLPRFFGLSKLEALELAAEPEPRPVVPARTVGTRAETRARPVMKGGEGTPLGATAPGAEAMGDLLGAHPGITGELDQDVHLGELWVARTTTEPERPTVAPMTATESRLHITVSREFLALLKKAKAGESHRNPGATDEQVLMLALETLIEKQGKRKAGVPAKVKREVVRRDEGKCRWKLADGGICGSTVRLEADHVHPRGQGGPSTVDNCRILCKGHNLEAARQADGDEVMDLFTRGGRDPLVGEEVAVHGAARDAGFGRQTSLRREMAWGVRGLRRRRAARARASATD